MLRDYFLQCNAPCQVYRNDIPLKKLTQNKYSGLVLSPGPGRPENSGILMEIIDHFHDKLPILGVCLGHQALAEYFGARTVNAIRPMHGKVDRIFCRPDLIFDKIPLDFSIVRYHSLVSTDLPEVIMPLAFTKEQELMAFKHQKLPIYGVQFHPEAFFTEYGLQLIKNWVKMVT